MTTTFDALADVVRARRTHLLVDGERPVPHELVEQLCELASWAPNHKKTWPWRFAAVTGGGRVRLGEAFVADMIDRGIGDEGKRIKTRTKYLRSPVVLVVGCAAHDHPTFHDENRDAVAAAIQNILLGATALGLASFWATAPVMDSPRVLEICDFDADDRIVALVYLGWPTGTVEAPDRPAPEIRRVTS